MKRVHRPVPRVVRVTLGGESLADFDQPRPGGHVKAAFGWDGERPTMRTYTPRRFDAQQRELDIEFVLHGAGVASDWAASAEVGDRLTIFGPGGRYEPQARSGVFVVVVDETAMPAAGTVIESLPAGTRIIAICEVEDPSDERPLSQTVEVAPRWLHRSTHHGEPSALLSTAVAELPPEIDADWFVACEATAVRAVRRHLLEDRGVDPERVQTRGYWRRGQSDYPDHDYGED